MRRFEKDMDERLLVCTKIQTYNNENGQSAANLVSDNKTVQRLDKVRYVRHVIICNVFTIPEISTNAGV